jgi:hypothetical protein
LANSTIPTINTGIEIRANIQSIRFIKDLIAINDWISQNTLDINQNIKLTIIHKNKTKTGDNKSKIQDFFIY